MNELQKNKTKGELVHFLCFQEKNIFFVLFFTQKGPFAFFLLFWHEKQNKKRKRQQTFDNFDKKKSSNALFFVT